MGVRRSSVIMWTKSYGLALVLAAVGVLLLGIGIGLGSAFIHRQPHFGVDIARAALTLGSGLILGGAVKAALDHYQQSQASLEQDRESRRQLVEDLRDIHERTECARQMIQAHRSADAYAAQMSVLIDCQVRLLKVENTMDLLRGNGADPRDASLTSMMRYLRELQEEFANNYSGLDDYQRYDRAVFRLQLTRLAADDADLESSDIASSHHTWELMRNRQRFPVLNDLLDCGERYVDEFRRPLHDLIKELWKARGAKPNTPFLVQVVQNVEPTVNKTVDSVEDALGRDEPNDDSGSGDTDRSSY